MNKNELEKLNIALQNNINILPNVNGKNIVKDENGQYHPAVKEIVTDRKSMVERVLNTLYHNRPNIFQDSTFEPSSESYLAAKKIVSEDEKLFITQDRDIYLALLLLRLEGILEYGRTPLCGQQDPIKFLQNLISESSVPYKDSISSLLEIPRLHGSECFLSNDEETAGEKLDKAVVLLSLLKPDDIKQYAEFDISQTGNLQCAFLEDGVSALLMPFIYLNAPQAKNIFQRYKFHDRFEIWPYAAKVMMANSAKLYQTDDVQNIAVDVDLAIAIIRICAKCGVSCEKWLHLCTEEMKKSETDIKQWEFEHFNDSVAEFITSHEGHFFLALSDNDYKQFISGNETKGFRKYLVDNGLLKDVSRYYLDFGFNSIVIYFIDIVKDGVYRNVRFFNQDNVFLEKDREHGKMKYRIFGFEDSKYPEDNVVYKFISKDIIADEDYNLDINLYNSYDHARAKNKVLLSELLTPIKGQPTTRNGLFECIAICDRPKRAQDNYNELLSEGIHDAADCREWYNENALFLMNKTWPLFPSFHQRSPESHVSRQVEYVDLDTNESDSKTETITLPEGLFMSSSVIDEDVMAFTINMDRVNPWYLAYLLQTDLVSQLRSRSHDGKITEKDFLKVFIDLPSLKEQKDFIEDVINRDIEKKKIQVGTSEALFDLNHSIGSPARRIQSLLGNLRDEYEGNSETYTQLKKIEDNFGYILRLIEAAGLNFERLKNSSHKVPIVELLHRYISSSSSLPFGLDPILDCSKVNNSLKVDVSESLFYIMMDNIIRNAHRHGFDKKVSSDNKVFISLDTVSLESKTWLQISVCNNGKKLDDNITVYDYVTKGAKGVSTGNTGQGGYDIHQIVRKFGGKLCLRYSEKWNFIIDILLPVDGYDLITTKKYTYGPLV